MAGKCSVNGTTAIVSFCSAHACRTLGSVAAGRMLPTSTPRIRSALAGTQKCGT
jgi:hypothetical protein